MTVGDAASLADLKNHVPPEYDPTGVSAKIAASISSAVKAILIEQPYIDKDYRSTYYQFYAKKGQRYRADSVRLHFFDGTVSYEPAAMKLQCPDGPDRLKDHYFGYMVLRPTGIATIGRSVVSPDVRTGAPRYIISGRHKVHVLGYRLEVSGFPSMDQHIDISVCAHVACWSILRHYSERYSLYREFLTHDITVMAHEFDPGGLVPSRGLQLSHAERVFQEAKTFPILLVASGPTDASFYRQLLAYVDSGFPLFAAMHNLGHAIAVVGYEWRKPSATPWSALRSAWDELQSLAVVDDNQLPYLSIPVTGSSNYSADDIDAFIVALPEKVYYPADAIDEFAEALFKFAGIVDLPDKNQTIIRYFITTGAALRSFVRDHESEFDPKLVEVIMTLPLAQFIWIIEFATQALWQVGQISARAVVDATASVREVLPLWLFHNRTHAAVCDRSAIPSDSIDTFPLSSTGHTAFTAMVQNLRPTLTK